MYCPDPAELLKRIRSMGNSILTSPSQFRILKKKQNLIPSSIKPTALPTLKPFTGPPSVTSHPYPTSLTSHPFPASVASHPFPTSVTSHPFPASVMSFPDPKFAPQLLVPTSMTSYLLPALAPRFPAPSSLTSNPVPAPVPAYPNSNTSYVPSYQVPTFQSIFPASVISQSQSVPKIHLDNFVPGKMKKEKKKYLSAKKKKEGNSSIKAKKSKLTTVEEFAKIIEQEKNFKLRVADFAR